MQVRDAAKLAAHSGIGDFTAAGAVAAYYGLQQVIPTMPDLPMWAVVTLMILASVRGLVMRYLDDGQLTADEAADALVEAAEDGREAMALVEARAGSEGDAAPEGESDPPGSNGRG